MHLVGIFDAIHFIVQQRTARCLIDHFSVRFIYKNVVSVALVLRSAK